MEREARFKRHIFFGYIYIAGILGHSSCYHKINIFVEKRFFRRSMSFIVISLHVESRIEHFFSRIL